MGRVPEFLCVPTNKYFRLSLPAMIFTPAHCLHPTHMLCSPQYWPCLLSFPLISFFSCSFLCLFFSLSISFFPLSFSLFLSLPTHACKNHRMYWSNAPRAPALSGSLIVGTEKGTYMVEKCTQRFTLGVWNY